MDESTNLIITLPDSVPEPKFELFQRVRHGKHTGVIVGMEWLCPMDALTQNMSSHGWSYRISFLYGKPPEAAFNAPDYGYDISEHCIHSIEGAEAA
ncbi:MAG: hypothetical protein AAFX78_18440 [Cyanobacteria bacterium J06638_20]